MASGAPIRRPLDEVTIFLAGDVMTGRGIDQIQKRPGDPELREELCRSAWDYVELAEAAHGPVPAPVDAAYIWGEALQVLRERAPAARIVNLETSVTFGGSFWPAKAVHYRMHPANIGCLRAAGIDACVLANNHVLDFGPMGLAETFTSLREAGIDTAGAGRDLAEARRPAVVMLGRGARALVAAVGSETSGIPPRWAATMSRPGVDLVPDLSEETAREVAGRLQRRRLEGDVTIVSIHWGSNWGYDIEPAMVRFARALVDAGVDIVHGHSSHHVRPIEVYRGKLILYGAGDLITDYEGIRGYEWYRGDLGAMIFATVSTRDGTLLRLRLVPAQMRQLRLRRPPAADAEALRDRLSRTSADFGSYFARDERDEIVLAESRGWAPR